MAVLRLFTVLFFLFSAGSARAQNSRTLYFNNADKVTTKASASYYSTVTRNERDTTLYTVKTFTASGKRTREGSYRARSFPVSWEGLHGPGFRDAVKEGLFREYHGNGQLRFEGQFQRGEGQGRHRWWHGSGSLQAEATLSGGRFEGQVTSYFEDGKVSLRYTALGGLIEGELTE